MIIKPMSAEELLECHRYTEFVHSIEPENALNEAKRLLLATIRRRDELLVKCLINQWHVQDDGDCGYEIATGGDIEPTEAETRELREIVYISATEKIVEAGDE